MREGDEDEEGEGEFPMPRHPRTNDHAFPSLVPVYETPTAPADWRDEGIMIIEKA